jgi:hypothetical protein
MGRWEDRPAESCEQVVGLFHYALDRYPDLLLFQWIQSGDSAAELDQHSSLQRSIPLSAG